MNPLQLFNDVWQRADMLGALHAFVSNQGTAALKPGELLRADWVARVSALDLYVHELVAQRMSRIVYGELPQTPAFRRFRVSTETSIRMKDRPEAEARAAYDLDVREQFGIQTFQAPDKIADAIRLCSPVKLWSEVAIDQNPGASPTKIEAFSKSIKATLSLIVDRRNKIAHEGDLQPSMPREPWPIAEPDLLEVRSFIQKIVTSIDRVLTSADLAE